MSLPPVFTILAATSAVTAIVGTNPVRVFPAGDIPQGQLLPAVAWQGIGGLPYNLLSDRPPADHQRVQIDCWAHEFGVADNLANEVRYALELSGYLVSLNGSDYDPETKRFRVSFDWNFITANEHA